MKLDEILKQFTSVSYVTGIGSSPARVNRKTRDLQINADKWDDIPETHKAFILLHELAHCLLDTSDEFLVDQLAFKMYADAGYSLKAGVQAVTSLLSDKNDAHRLRAYLQLERAKMYDYSINGNKQVYETNLITKNNKKVCDCNNRDNGGSSIMLMKRLGNKTEGFFENWNGCQEGEKPKNCRKRIRVEANATAKENRSEGKRLKGEARATLAEQGIAEANGMDKFKQGVGAVGEAAKGLFAKGGDDAGGADAPKDNKMLYIGLAAGAVVLVLVAVLFIFKK
jgi:hypothetical protein